MSEERQQEKESSREGLIRRKALSRYVHKERKEEKKTTFKRDTTWNYSLMGRLSTFVVG
jgi:hypothetical protein